MPGTGAEPCPKIQEIMVILSSPVQKAVQFINTNDLASILVAIADLPTEQKEALAKLLASAPAAEKLGQHRNTSTIPSVTIMVLQWI